MERRSGKTVQSGRSSSLAELLGVRGSGISHPALFQFVLGAFGVHCMLRVLGMSVGSSMHCVMTGHRFIGFRAAGMCTEPCSVTFSNEPVRNFVCEA
jgi:hypothetical protein